MLCPPCRPKLRPETFPAPPSSLPMSNHQIIRSRFAANVHERQGINVSGNATLFSTPIQNCRPGKTYDMAARSSAAAMSPTSAPATTPLRSSPGPNKVRAVRCACCHTCIREYCERGVEVYLDGRKEVGWVNLNAAPRRRRLDSPLSRMPLAWGSCTAEPILITDCIFVLDGVLGWLLGISEE
jgi:hypothetical protein